MAECVFKTNRFAVYLTNVVRNPKIGLPRDVYMAWFKDEDVPRSVCEITIFKVMPPYIEWIHVCETYRRQGIATEVLKGLEDFLGELEGEGVTPSGEAFLDSYQKGA